MQKLGQRKWVFKRERSAVLRLFALSAALSASFLAVSHAQTPQEEDPFRALLTQRGPAAVKLNTRTPQLFETTEGDETFVFQTDGRTALIRFHCDDTDADLTECALLGGLRGEEIYALTATRSPRGDVIYKDVDNEAVLRVTTNGGATLFSPSETTQAPVSNNNILVPLGGKAVLPVPNTTPSLIAPALTYDEADARMGLASDIFETKIGVYIPFVGSGPQGRTNHAVLADAVLTAAKGIDYVIRDPLGADALAKGIQMVRFVPGEKSDLSYEKRVLTITYARDKGIAGRPSSAAVARYLESTL